ncbi:SgcJ/EcaC family oxidoreductase [Ktedonospora formicarum]|uniref:DUF4440 domain-containing protein n=1 Tax=Ktedonospora formicarum TaxID=2778364 RepID=A0A8J3MX65_9CHLR|nr:SgcJ/EcaC family oxidoreductase [Ktedonospora formicarum]GHO49423.1 hypothetical protein KSX_75860 [Ktedonospora formicarum]
MAQFQSDSNEAKDIEDIQSLLKQLIGYWNNGDGQGYGTCFTEDADYVDVMGTHSKGAIAIAKLHQFLFTGPLKGSQLEGYREPRLEFLSPTVALLISGGASRLDGQEVASDDRQSINTTVFVKNNGQWLIRAFQNNRVTPFPGKPAGRPM